MRTVREIILANNDSYNHFSYYETIIDVIESNVEKQPDICIESCKALVEGLSKAILNNLDRSFTREQLDKFDFQPLFKKALAKLSEYNEEVEIDFINRACSLIQILGEFRNKRGDISHGRLAPKEIFSDKQLSRLVMQMTESLAFYMLVHFYSIDLTFTKDVLYEDNDRFNTMLDENFPLEFVSYSRALYDQDKVSYIEQLEDFKSLEEENEDL